MTSSNRRDIMKSALIGATLPWVSAVAGASSPTAARTGDVALDTLVSAFENPPSDAKPAIFWYWLSDNITAEGIRADLQAMHDAGIGLVLLFSIGSLGMQRIIDPAVPSLTPAWWDLIHLAASECDRLGMQLLMNSCDGWATAGGPWITPELSMQKLVWSETVTPGGLALKTLPQPETLHDHYRDIRTIAMPRPADWDRTSITVRPAIGGSLAVRDAARLLDPANDEAMVESDREGTLVFDFGRPFLLRSVTIRTPAPPKSGGAPLTAAALRAAHEMRVEASDDGRAWRAVGALEFPKHGWQTPLDRLTHALPQTQARYFRFTHTPRRLDHFREDMQFGENPALRLASILLSGRPVLHHLPIKSGETWGRSLRMDAADLPDNACISADSIIDLSDHLQPDGTLNWTPPRGSDWTVLRIGHTSTGADNHPVTKNGHGLECDKFNPAAAELQFDRWFAAALAKVGPGLAGRTLHIFHVDSWEARSQNWSPLFAGAFAHMRGYDLLPLLPVMAGIPIDSAERSERILFDVRRTIADCVTENFYAPLKARCEAHGCLFSGEVSNPTMPTDGLAFGRSVDIPMGEFWHRTPQNYKPSDIHEAVSAAHIYGRRVAGAEAFTNFAIDWDETPWMLKALGDHHYALGINRFFLHVYAHQPWVDRSPGMTLSGIGTFFSRTQTWWKPGKAWFDYLARSQAVLQQGDPVVDIAMFIGEDIPARAVLEEDLPISLPAGYRFDSINRDALMRLAHVADGRLLLPGGARYRALVLPAGRHMTPELAERIAELSRAGLLVIGEAPRWSASARGAIDADRRVTAAATRMRLTGYDRAHDLAALLDEHAIAADILFEQGGQDIEWTHRAGAGWDIYFLSNQSDEERRVTMSLRAAGAVEIWDADSGIRSAHAGEPLGDRTRVRLALPPRGALFVLLGRAAAADPVVRIDGDGDGLSLGPVSQPASALAAGPGPWVIRYRSGRSQPIRGSIPPSPIALDGPWELAFGDGPFRAWPVLADWSDSDDDAVRHFSGTARYRTQVDLPMVDRLCWQIDLGRLAEMAELWVNGRRVGVAWKPPYILDISATARKGRNLIEIAITNSWKNRLVGDAGKSAATRGTFLFPEKRFGEPWQPTASAPLLPAGLFGPVVLSARHIVPLRA